MENKEKLKGKTFAQFVTKSLQEKVFRGEVFGEDSHLNGIFSGYTYYTIKKIHDAIIAPRADIEYIFWDERKPKNFKVYQQRDILIHRVLNARETNYSSLEDILKNKSKLRARKVLVGRPKNYKISSIYTIQ